ncbi:MULTISPECIES: phosphopantetheine-binding protein [unclassified Streptomyces]|uniref:phosphopantetheine-binding protein n=1 Tax=unclassified Streptomyces TaxID=2593676 RepID=UPI00331EDB57
MNTPWDSRFEALVMRHVDLGRDGGLRPDDDLLGHGLDSIAIVELVVSLEETYDIEIPDERLTQQSFTTPATLWSVVSGPAEREPSREGAA